MTIQTLFKKNANAATRLLAASQPYLNTGTEINSAAISCGVPSIYICRKGTQILCTAIYYDHGKIVVEQYNK